MGSGTYVIVPTLRGLTVRFAPILPPPDGRPLPAVRNSASTSPCVIDLGCLVVASRPLIEVSSLLANCAVESDNEPGRQLGDVALSSL